MNDYDFGRSFLRWTSTRNNHSPRLMVDAICALDGVEFAMSAMCAGERMYLDSGLIYEPPCDFGVICKANDQFVFFKWYGDETLNQHEIHKLGEAMTTQDGRGAPMTEMPVFMARHRKMRRLEAYADVREAILGNRLINGETEYLGEDGHTRVTLKYPLKICNVANGRDRWQVDTPACIPDLTVKSDLPVGMLRMGYVVYNTPDWAEICMRHPKSSGKFAGKSVFTEPRRIQCTNTLWVADE